MKIGKSRGSSRMIFAALTIRWPFRQLIVSSDRGIRMLSKGRKSIGMAMTPSCLSFFGIFRLILESFPLYGRLTMTMANSSSPSCFRASSPLARHRSTKVLLNAMSRIKGSKHLLFRLAKFLCQGQ